MVTPEEIRIASAGIRNVPCRAGFRTREGCDFTGTEGSHPRTSQTHPRRIAQGIYILCGKIAGVDLRDIPDPRIEKKCDHPLENIMAIAICAIIAGADDWNAIASFGKAKKEWFDTFLDLKNGIPSHDTFRRLFSILSPKTFQDFFTGWVKDIAGLVEGAPTCRSVSA